MTDVPCYKQEFPDYDTQITLPEGWEDVSFRNDATPSFINRALGLCLWVNFLNPDLRAFPESCRFTVTGLDPDGCHMDGVDDLLHTDEWAAVQTFLEDREAAVFAISKLDRSALNDWYEENVGYRPDDDLGQVGEQMPLPELRSLVVEMFRVHANTPAC